MLSLPSSSSHLRQTHTLTSPSIISLKKIPFSFPFTLLSLPSATFAFCPSWAFLLHIKWQATSGAFHHTQRVTALLLTHACTCALSLTPPLCILTLSTRSEVTVDWHPSHSPSERYPSSGCVSVHVHVFVWWICWCWNVPVAFHTILASFPAKWLLINAVFLSECQFNCPPMQDLSNVAGRDCTVRICVQF